MRCSLALFFVMLAASSAVAQPIQRADLKPGLVFTAGATTRLEPGVGLTLDAGEVESPLLWAGTINILQAGKYRFDATVAGSATVSVGDKVVFQAGQVSAKFVEGAEVELPAGIQLFQAKLVQSPPAARLELFWRGPGFRPEPVPYYFFGHLPSQRPRSFAASVARDHGRFLVEEHACVKCHAAEAPTRLAERSGPNLTRIAERTNPGWLDAWLKDPHALRPNTVMPRMFAEDAAGRAERHAVVTYLSGLGTPTRPAPVGLSEMSKSVASGQKLYLTVGCATCHGDQVTAGFSAAKKKDDEEDEKPALVPLDGLYNQGTASPQLAYVLGHPGSKFPAEPLAKYLRDPLATNPHGRMPSLNLTSEEARDLARYLTRATDEKLTAEMPPAPETAEKRSRAEWADMGQKLFASKGCVNCHAIDGAKAPPLQAKAASLQAVSRKPAAGCLGEKPDPARHPSFQLDVGQRVAVAAFLTSLIDAKPVASPVPEARASFKRFGCLNCHNRDGEGGIGEDLAAKMRSLETAENADDVAPPRLTQVGHKLRSSWTKKVLLEGGRARPWMSLRMPQYGEPNVGHLTEALPKLEGSASDDTLGKVELTAAKVEAGKTLAGKDGMGCIACHDLGGISGGGTRGPDLARTHERVRLDWFGRWMHQPQRLAPGTKMPTNYIDGKALFTSVYGGDGDKQIDAMWAYFSLGQGLPLPNGMEPPKGLIVKAVGRPEILRTFMPDNAGTRPIALGFPGGVNAVFDAATCRVSYAWAGNFLDATPVWNNRGGNPARLLGPKFWTGPAGFPWATTRSDDGPPDFARRFADPAYGHQLANDSYSTGPRYVHFEGYALDAGGLPTFAYALWGNSAANELAVTEKVEPLPVLTAPGLRRTFQVAPGEGRVTWLAVGVSPKEPSVLTVAGEKVAVDFGAKPAESPAPGTRVICNDGGDRTVVYEVPPPAKGAENGAAKQPLWVFVARPEGGYAVLLRWADAAKTQVTLDTWGLPRPDEALLRGLRR